MHLAEAEVNTYGTEKWEIGILELKKQRQKSMT